MPRHSRNQSRTVYRIQHPSGRIEETTDRRVAACASREGCRVAAVTRSGP